MENFFEREKYKIGFNDKFIFYCYYIYYDCFYFIK